MTGQTLRNAIHQYEHDRNPKDLIFQFGKRTLVHFAVDSDMVYMTTRLAGPDTVFLPFNKGDGTGAGNPKTLRAQDRISVGRDMAKRQYYGDYR